MQSMLHLKKLLEEAVTAMGLSLPQGVSLEPPKDIKFGDLATNAAMILAKQAGKPPREVAAELRERLLGSHPEIERIEVAGPGFLNFSFAPSFWQSILQNVLEQGDRFGALDIGQKKKVLVEYVSANPTGPLHLGHGRGAALGDSLVRVLRFAGFDVTTEFYINDAGRQMRLLGLSIWVRYQQAFNRDVELPEDSYRGEYIKDIAAEIAASHGSELLQVPEAQAMDVCREHGMLSILKWIKRDLNEFRVSHDIWFSERRLVDTGQVESTIKWLQDKGLAYEQEGALWFNSTRFGDDKDRVLRRSSGELTYFASDIAYHADKYSRGYDLLVDIWGADHHGYVPRMKAAAQALGKDADQLQVVLVQMVNILRGGEQISMSKRAGTFETLADVVKEVGVDSARFMFMTRKSDSHLDFDLELVKQQSMDNPVYYVQYAHARIRSVFRKAREQGLALQPTVDRSKLMALLDTPEDIQLLKLMDHFPDAVDAAARSLSPHHISFFLRELAALLHRYYTVHKVLGAESSQLTLARLLLLDSVSQVLRNGLQLLGVNAPEQM
ncbi:arginyl-tRNA synthetase [Desulfocurvibacter africanus PCS]|uniref:Arginine--tRNA ligase n=1 Tax=Desulfocurvibacter africanus PCS TaxID=1262666 RepID=M5Q3L4_DESAF|nr:arginine--tRNA ligase [Desulfocurvibacter africanus]EMG38653.1 arginyl-tRNA synthetase [Desulfocurvibacter africanus PCS]